MWDEHTGWLDGPVELVGAAVRWHAPVFAGFIAAVATWAAVGLVVNLTSGRVYAPYDGGADLFLSSETERDLARARYLAWLPRDD